MLFNADSIISIYLISIIGVGRSIENCTLNVNSGNVAHLELNASDVTFMALLSCSHGHLCSQLKIYIVNKDMTAAHIRIPLIDYYCNKRSVCDDRGRCQTDRTSLIVPFHVKGKKLGFFGISFIISANTTTIWLKSLHLPIRRKPRAVDYLFDFWIAAIAYTLSLCTGCLNDVRGVRPYFDRPGILFAMLFSHHFIMPMVGLTVSRLMGLDHLVSFGLIVTACAPSSGTVQLTIHIMQGDKKLNALTTLCSGVLLLGTTPTMIYAINMYFKTAIDIGTFIIWFIPCTLCHVTGATVRAFRPEVAKGVLNWFVSPLVLLSVILLYTVGLYINRYAYHADQAIRIVFAVALFTITGFALGYAIALVAGQSRAHRKTYGAGLSTFNSILSITALRTSLPSPANDIASMYPLWATYMLPIPIVLYVIEHWIKRQGQDFIQKRREEKLRQRSALSTLASGIARDVHALLAKQMQNNVRTEDQLDQFPNDFSALLSEETHNKISSL